VTGVQTCALPILGSSIVGSLQLYFDYFTKSYSQADIIIAITDFYKRKFIEFGMAPEKIIVIPNFFERNSEINNVHPTEKDYILYFGRLSQEKGIHHLIRAMKNVNEKIILNIVGNGSQTNVLQELVAELNLKNVFFVGELKGKDLDSIISESLFTITPSVWYENFPNTIVESFYFSKPVIGSDIGGIPELVQEGETGLLFRPGNSEELAQKINYLYENPIIRNDLGIKAKQFIEEKLTSELHYQKLMDVYNSVIRRKQYN
jgi:glycosyltransferase involved in cell wall biosynthesis